MSMTRYEKVGGPTKEQIIESIFQAFETEGLLTEHGTRDWDTVFERMIEHYHDGHVITDGIERPLKGISKGEMTEQIFPHLPGPGVWADQKDPLLAEATWDGITSDLWTHTRPNSRLQKLLQGYTVCRHKTTSKGEVSYITRNRKLVMEDAKYTLDRRVRTAVRQADEFTARVIQGNPDDRQYYSDQHGAILEDVQLESSRAMERAVAQATEATR